MLKKYIQKIAENENLTFEESQESMDIIMNGQASPEQIAGFISIMRMKQETVDEIAGFAIKMREHAMRIKKPEDKIVIDTCGTGGDKKNTFNISTVAAFVVSGAGVCVAKHGNRAVSSKCGSADVLRHLGVNIDIPIEKVEECLFEVGMSFLFAPMFHPAMKHAIGPRRELGIRTFFNIIGPLTNPAFVDRQIIGVFSNKLLEKMAQVLNKMDSKRALIVHSEDGLDEISLCSSTDIAELEEDGKIKIYKINPNDFGFEFVDESELTGGDVEDNANIVWDILNGKKGAKSDIVVLNAAAALYVSGIADDFEKGIELAKESIVSGAAKEKLEQLIAFTNKNV